MLKRSRRAFFLVASLGTIGLLLPAIHSRSQQSSPSQQHAERVKIVRLETTRGAVDYYRGYVDGRLGIAQQWGKPDLKEKGFPSYGDESAAYNESDASAKRYFFIERKGTQVIVIDHASSLEEIQQLLKDHEEKVKKMDSPQ
jgi:hypothetical protein